MSVIFFLMSIGPMSPVDLKKNGNVALSNLRVKGHVGGVGWYVASVQCVWLVFSVCG